MNKYNSALDKIHVSPDMEQRITANLEKESRRVYDMPLRRENSFLKNMRLVYAIAACCVLVFSVATFYSLSIKQKGPDSTVGVVNPYKTYGSIDELKKALPFVLNIPAKIPSQYQIKEIDSISGKTAHIMYSDGNETMTFRATLGSEDISGDFNIYTTIQTKLVSSMEATFKGNGDLIYLAIWSDSTCSYSLSISQGMSEALVLEMIQSLSK